MKNSITLIVSVVVGLLAAILTRAYLVAKDAEVTRAKAALEARYGTMDVLCVVRAVPGGTALSKADLGVKRVPKAGLVGQALTEENVGDVIGRRILRGHAAKEILFWADIEGGKPNRGGLASDVRKGMRAVSINASGAAAVSGMVRPNDHVDVLGTFTFPAPEKAGRAQQELVTCTILQNVLVLATGKETAKQHAQGGANGYSTVTLEVSPREAEMLVFAEQIKGRLALTLRNDADTSYETQLPRVDFKKIEGEIEGLNALRQQRLGNGVRR